MTSDSERPEPPDDAEVRADADGVDEAGDGAPVEAVPSEASEEDGGSGESATDPEVEGGEVATAAAADETTLLPAATDTPPVATPAATPAGGGWREWLRARVTNPPQQPSNEDPPSFDGPLPPPSKEVGSIADPSRAAERPADLHPAPREPASEHPETMDTSTFPVQREDGATAITPRSGLRRSLHFWENQTESVAEAALEPRPDWDWSPEEAIAGDRAGSARRLPVRPELTTGVPVRFGSLAELRAERRELRRQISEQQFDLGGLHVEMVRQARIDHPLLEARALELVAANDRLAIVERAIEARRRGDDPAWASLRPCSACGAPRPQDASFCPYCGTPVTPSSVRRPE